MLRFVRPLVWVGLLAFLIVSIAAYSALPAMIPRSIDANGVARGLTPRTPWLWGFPVLMAVGTIGFAEVLRAQLPGKPHLFNFPGKEQLLKLPAEYRAGAILRMQQFMDVMNAQLLVTFALVQWMNWCGANGQTSQGGIVATLLIPVGMLVALGLFLQYIQSAVDEGQRKYDSRRNPLR
jgi:uncharacterized membrane protein